MGSRGFFEARPALPSNLVSTILEYLEILEAICYSEIEISD